MNWTTYSDCVRGFSARGSAKLVEKPGGMLAEIYRIDGSGTIRFFSTTNLESVKRQIEDIVGGRKTITIRIKPKVMDHDYLKAVIAGEYSAAVFDDLEVIDQLLKYSVSAFVPLGTDIQFERKTGGPDSEKKITAAMAYRLRFERGLDIR